MQNILFCPVEYRMWVLVCLHGVYRQKWKCRWFCCLFYNLKMMAESNDCFCWIDTSCDKRINPSRTGNCFSKFTHIIFAFKKHHFVFINFQLKMCLRFFCLFMNRFADRYVIRDSENVFQNFLILKTRHFSCIRCFVFLTCLQN